MLGIEAEEVLAGRRSPLGKPGGGEGRPAGLHGVVEGVAVGEMFHQEAVGVAPVVEELAALDVPADAPGPEIALLAQEFAARGQGVEIADLIGRVDVAVRRAQRDRQGVVVARGAATVTADEAHRGAAVALAGVVQEVADDQSEVVQVPVQCLHVSVGR